MTDCGRASIGRYVKGKCRCDECRACSSRHMRRWRQARAVEREAPEVCLICGWRGWILLAHETAAHSQRRAA